MAKLEFESLKLLKEKLYKLRDTLPQEIGREGVEILRDATESKNVTNRLHDSFSWASKKSSSGVGPTADSTDAVPRPETLGAVNIGTLCPYAASINYGTTNNFKYGENGAPANFTELKKAIEEWLKARISQGTWNGPEVEKVHSVAYTIAKNIEKYGTDAFPFWEESKARILEFANEMAESASADIIKNIKIPKVTAVEVKI
jgi:hypothetical protein